MTNAQMKTGRFLALHKARRMFRFIMSNLDAGNSVSVTTYTRSVSAAQMKMLRDLDDGDPTDYADFADAAGAVLGGRNRERVLSALIRKGLIDDDLKLTDSGRETLAAAPSTP